MIALKTRKPRRTLRTFSVFTGMWSAIMALVAFIIAFPVTSKIVLLTAAITLLLIATWKLAETYVND